MPNPITDNVEMSEFSGRIVITKYGRNRICQKIAEGADFVPFNLCKIVLGDKISYNYDGDSVTEMGNKTYEFDITDDNITMNGNIVRIETHLDIEGGMIMRELGVVEKIDGKEYLFAYASGFDMIKEESVSFTLVINLALSEYFENEHYRNYDVSLNTNKYALFPEVTKLYEMLSTFQLDFERCVEGNAKELGYFTPQVLSDYQARLSNMMLSVLTFNRFNKISTLESTSHITDCFFYTGATENNYKIRNVKGEAIFLSDEKRAELELLARSCIDSGEWETFKSTISEVHAKYDAEVNPVSYVKDNKSIDLDWYLKSTLGEGNYEISEEDFNRITEMSIQAYRDKDWSGFLEELQAVVGTIEDTLVPRLFYRKFNMDAYLIHALGYKWYEDSFMEVNGKLQKCNRDNIDLSRPATIIAIATLKSITEDGIIMGKLDPNRDEYYFDIRLVDGAFQFTIYSYDEDNYIMVKRNSKNYDEKQLVGHFRVKYYPDESMLQKILYNEVMYTFCYNGDVKNPKLQMFIGTEDVSDKLVISNMNYLGPCKSYRKSTTLRNYSATANTSAYQETYYYYKDDIDISTFMVYDIILSLDDIRYMSLIYQM